MAEDIELINIFGIRPTVVDIMDGTVTINVTNNLTSDEVFYDLMVIYLMTWIRKLSKENRLSYHTVILQGHDVTYDLNNLPEYFRYLLMPKKWYITGELYDKKYMYCKYSTILDGEVEDNCDAFLEKIGMKTHFNDSVFASECCIRTPTGTEADIFEYSIIEDRLLLCYGVKPENELTMQVFYDEILHCVRVSAHLCNITFNKINCLCYDYDTQVIGNIFDFDLTGPIPDPPAEMLTHLHEVAPDLY